MSKIDILRGQHDAALNIGQRLLDLVNAYSPGDQIYPILMQLNRLHGMLRVHLAYEDLELYPRLMASNDQRIAKTAMAYVDEMGGLALQLESFARHWSCSASISNNFDEFREATNNLMLALAVRIERENRYLYPLAEGGKQREAA